jgi:sortase B
MSEDRNLDDKILNEDPPVETANCFVHDIVVIPNNEVEPASPSELEVPVHNVTSDQNIDLMKDNKIDEVSSEPLENKGMEVSNLTSPDHNTSDYNTSDQTTLNQDTLVNTTISKKNHKKIKQQRNIYRSLRLCSIIAFFVFTGLFLNEILIQPYNSNKVIQEVQNLYQKESVVTPVIKSDKTKEENAEDTLSTDEVEQQIPMQLEGDYLSSLPANDPNRDNLRRLLQFKELLNVNSDVKGWLTIPDSNMNYAVLQSASSDPEYYLTRNIYKENDKNGSLFLDKNSSIENNTKNFVIHGHNMKSTDSMFHHLLDYKKLDFYKERPVITFDTIYETGKWKIIALFITNGSSEKEELFNYTRSTFDDSSDFLNFVYQIKVRSLYHTTVDINQNDQLLTLSTCSYELNDYRTVLVARKVRPDEDLTVDVDRVTKNENPLYPESWYKNYDGTPPDLATFEEALEAGQISWYTPVE